MKHNYPILEFDPAPTAIINPKQSPDDISIPEHVVICFFKDVIDDLILNHNATHIYSMRSEMGAHPIYEIDVEGRRLAFFHSAVGAPLAAGLLDEVIGLGGVKFIACGGCGVLDSKIALGHVLVPTCAVRDEGTSYHYAAPSREISADPIAVAAIEKTLQAHSVDYLSVKTWTTDAFFRETPNKVKRRKEEGCLCVEMEASAFMAVAQFRSVTFGQILYSGDDLGGELWDHRDWHSHTTAREKLFWLAAEACFAL